jgi:predicted molibdopterin-dependent oxidoreductase YjgC
MPARRYICDGLDVIPPMSMPGYRLLTVSHPLFLNSQIPPGLKTRDASLFISREVAAAEKLMDGQPLRVKNRVGFFEAPCRVTSALEGPVVMTYKNRPFLKNGANHVVESRATDAGSGLDYYDTFVTLEKR